MTYELYSQTKINSELTYVGNSGDTRPVLTAKDVNVTLVESDTGHAFVWTGTQWLQYKIAGRDIPLDNLQHQGVVAHAHDEGGHVSGQIEITSSGRTAHCLVDLSDTATFPHDNTSWVHTANMILSIDADQNAKYEFIIGFVDNVTATEADFHHVLPLVGSKSTGTSIQLAVAQQPEAPRMRRAGFLGRITSETIINSATMLPSAVDGIAVAAPADGDIILIADVTAGAIKANILIGYHTH